MGIPTKAGVKRHPSSVSHFSGITREYEHVSTHSYMQCLIRTKMTDTYS